MPQHWPVLGRRGARDSHCHHHGEEGVKMAVASVFLTQLTKAYVAETSCSQLLSIESAMYMREITYLEACWIYCDVVHCGVAKRFTMFRCSCSLQLPSPVIACSSVEHSYR